MIRAQHTYDYDPLTVMRAYGDPDNRKRYDPLVSDIRMAKQYGTNLSLFYEKTYRIVVVCPRDILMYSFFNIEKDGSILQVMWSCEDVEYPKDSQQEIVRAKLPIGGCIFTPDAKNPNKTKFRHVLELDLGGNIPDFASQKVIQNQGYGLIYLKKMI